MTSIVPPVVTQDANINVLDRAGFSVPITYSDALGPVDISADNIRFECGSVDIALTPNGLGKTLTVLQASIDIIEAEQSTRFAVINRSVTPPKSIWEGYIFIRNVD